MKRKSGKLKYEDAPDLRVRMEEIIRILAMEHIDVSRVGCMRSFGSSSRGTIARCHALGKLMQKAMGTKAFYAIEFLERFEKLSKKDQDKVIIHELMHIPRSFGGGFRHHNFVCEENVDLLYQKFEQIKNGNLKGSTNNFVEEINKTKNDSRKTPSEMLGYWFK